MVRMSGSSGRGRRSWESGRWSWRIRRRFARRSRWRLDCARGRWIFPRAWMICGIEVQGRGRRGGVGGGGGWGLVWGGGGGFFPGGGDVGGEGGGGGGGGGGVGGALAGLVSHVTARPARPRLLGWGRR